MEVLITGGQGFLGQELCRYVLRKGQLTNSAGEVQTIQRTRTLPLASFDLIVLFDNMPASQSAVNADPKVLVETGDLTDAATCRKLLEKLRPDGDGGISIFHLAGVMSGAAEKDFDLGPPGWSSVDHMQKQPGGSLLPKFVFTSSLAVFGETYVEAGIPVGDTDKIVPKNTYGMTKACGELFINDYTRKEGKKGFIDGRTARLPTVIVRPGKPNAATTSCYSGVIREPLHGVEAVILHDAKWPADRVDRALNLPSRPSSLQQLVDALYEVVPPSEVGQLGSIEDEFLSRVVRSMGSHLSHDRAKELGMLEVPDMATVVREFLEDFGEETVHAWPTGMDDPYSMQIGRFEFEGSSQVFNLTADVGLVRGLQFRFQRNWGEDGTRNSGKFAKARHVNTHFQQTSSQLRMVSSVSSVVLTECFVHEGQTFRFPKKDPPLPPRARTREAREGDLPSLPDVRDAFQTRSRSCNARGRSRARRHRSVGTRYPGRSRSRRSCRSRAHRSLSRSLPSERQRALTRKIPQHASRETPMAIEDSRERKTDIFDDDPDRLMEQAMIFSFCVKTGKLRGASKVYFRDMVFWAEYSRSNKIGEFRKQARGKGKQEFPKLNVASDFRDLKRWLGKRKLTDYLTITQMDRVSAASST
eukprot:s641_g9.t2